RRGQVLELSGRLSEAEMAYGESVTLRRRASAVLSEDVTKNFSFQNSPALGLVDLARFHVRHGQAERAAERCAEALGVYEKSLARYPHSDALHLAWFLVNCPVESQRNPARAVQLCRKTVGAVSLTGSETIAGTLGAAQYRTGDLHAAVASLDK